MARRQSPPLSAPKAGQLFRLLGEPARLHILLLLLRQKGEACLGDLAAVAGLTRAATVYHLMMLRRGGVVGARRAGQQVFYRITSPLVLELLREVEEG
jgi:DNA-binding transcriptional ArsR family regulator